MDRLSTVLSVLVPRRGRVRIFDLVLWVCVGIVTVPAARGDVVTPDAVDAAAVAVE